MGGLYTQVQLIRGHTRRIIKGGLTANCQYIFAELSRGVLRKLCHLACIMVVLCLYHEEQVTL